jgi:hypothetical protein
VEVGDVLIVGVAIQAPVHSMVVVNKRSLGGHSWVYIRGFNNVATLGTGAQLQYDAHVPVVSRFAMKVLPNALLEDDGHCRRYRVLQCCDDGGVHGAQI